MSKEAFVSGGGERIAMNWTRFAPRPFSSAAVTAGFPRIVARTSAAAEALAMTYAGAVAPAGKLRWASS